MKELLKGRLVRLSAVDPRVLGQAYSHWNRDSEFKRLLDTDPARLYSSAGVKQRLEKTLEKDSSTFHFFAIHALEDDSLLGDITLEVHNWGARDAFMGIGLGERGSWGKGYGTDAINLILRFAFTELNLRRVSLTVFEYNPRAIRCYEKAGFQHEGCVRGGVNREGQHWDELYMGLIREEWLETQTREQVDR
jgi:RimJ/RimL family protein N-acetyltransferase